MISSPLHVVLGAGQVGNLLAQSLVSRGLRVRVVRRSSSVSPGRFETRAADVADPAQATAAMQGAAVVYHCANPPYDRWPELLLPMTRGILEGTARVGARLVVLDNLYMYGADTSRMNEATPVAPRSKKGELRARASEEMLAANARGTVRVAIGRASDFFGPGATLSTIFGDRFFRRVLAGKSAECPGDPEQPHSYSYTPDVAEALAVLGTHGGAEGVWMLPVLPAESTRAVIDRFGRALGRPIAITHIPDFALRALGIVRPLLREVAEMTYQWKQPFVVDDARFRKAYGLSPTGWDEAMATTLEWATGTYRPAVAA